MKIIFIISILLVTDVLFAGGIINVKSEGVALITYENINTIRESAIQDALRKAVTKVNGMRLNSASYTANYELKYDRIFVQNGGIIKDYEVISEYRKGNYYIVKVTAAIIKSKGNEDRITLSKNTIRLFVDNNRSFPELIDNLTANYVVTENKESADIIICIKTEFHYDKSLFDGVIAGRLNLTVRVLNRDGIIISDKSFQGTAIGSTHYIVNSKAIKNVMPQLTGTVNKVLNGISADKLYSRKQRWQLEIWVISRDNFNCKFLMNSLEIENYDIQEVSLDNSNSQLIKISIRQQIRTNEIIEKAQLLGHFKILGYSDNILKLEEIM